MPAGASTQRKEVPEPAPAPTPEVAAPAPRAEEGEQPWQTVMPRRRRRDPALAKHAPPAADVPEAPPAPVAGQDGRRVVSVSKAADPWASDRAPPAKEAAPSAKPAVDPFAVLEQLRRGGSAPAASGPEGRAETVSVPQADTSDGRSVWAVRTEKFGEEWKHKSPFFDSGSTEPGDPVDPSS